MKIFLTTSRDSALNHPLVQISHSAWATQSHKLSHRIIKLEKDPQDHQVQPSLGRQMQLHKMVNFLKWAGDISLFLYTNISVSSLGGHIYLCVCASLQGMGYSHHETSSGSKFNSWLFITAPSWRCWMELWASCSGDKCPCLMQGVGKRFLRSSPTQPILWVCSVSMVPLTQLQN